MFIRCFGQLFPKTHTLIHLASYLDPANTWRAAGYYIFDIFWWQINSTQINLFIYELSWLGPSESNSTAIYLALDVFSSHKLFVWVILFISVTVWYTVAMSLVGVVPASVLNLVRLCSVHDLGWLEFSKKNKISRGEGWQLTECLSHVLWQPQTWMNWNRMPTILINGRYCRAPKHLWLID